MSFLLDTCVLSEVAKPSPSEAVIEWVQQQDEHRLFVSVLTLGEIQKGVSSLAEGRRRTRLQSWLDNDLRDRFAGRILTIEEKVALAWGALSARASRMGTSLPVVDGMLAAAALTHGLLLVTRNTRHVKPTGVPVLNPWQGDA